MSSALDYSQIPSGPPPPGVKPNFVDPVSQAQTTTIVISILLPLTLIFVGLRTYSTLRITRTFGRPDYACIIATMAAISYISVMYLTLSQGIFGRHIWDAPESMNTDSSVQNFTVLAILYGPAIFLAKLSILLLYLQLFFVSKRTRVMVYIALTINTLHCLATVIGYGILCVPKPGVPWVLADATYNCMVVADLFAVILGAISIFSDVFIFCIPIPVVWNLHLPTRKRVGVFATFITGLFAVLASILATVYRVRQYRNGDNTWNGAISYMLTVVEICVSIMCSCMPSYAAYLGHHIRSLRSLMSRLTSRTSKGSNGRKQSAPLKMHDFNRVDSNPNDKLHLTFGSAVRNGEFLETRQSTQQVWPLWGDCLQEGAKATNRDAWDGTTQGSASKGTTQGSMV